MSRPAVCHCASCDGRAPDDDNLDDEDREAARKRHDAIDDAADAHFDRVRDERDRP